MRPGIRLQLVVALAGLFALAFVPLYLAFAGLTRATLRAERDAHAKALGRVIAARVADAQATRAPGELVALLDAQLGTAAGLYGIAVYDASGQVVTRAGGPEMTSLLPARVDPGVERARPVTSPHGRALEVTVPGPSGSVVAVLRTDDEVARAGPLLRLLALYTLIVGLALMVFVYFSLTRMVVQPIDALSQAARRVAGGGRMLEPPRSMGAAELVDLRGSLVDMTARLRGEEEALRRKVEELERATVELRAAQQSVIRSERLASVGRLAAGLAHEVGNPLAAILGLEDLLIEGGLTPEEEKDFALRMRKETERIHRILRDLLDYARPATAHSERPKEPGQVSAAIGDVVNLLRPQKTMRDVDLAIEIDADLPDVALSNEHLVQVVLNLIANASDATGPGGHVVARAAFGDDVVVLEVEDDGPGIDPQVTETLFEPFVTTKDVGKGTGLGLAVCRGLVEDVGGTISALARRDGTHGARFEVRLPVVDARPVTPR